MRVILLCLLLACVAIAAPLPFPKPSTPLAGVWVCESEGAVSYLALRSDGTGTVTFGVPAYGAWGQPEKVWWQIHGDGGRWIKFNGTGANVWHTPIADMRRIK